MDLPESLTQALIDRKLIPFLGAGFSFPSGVPSWPRLISDLATTEGPAGKSLEGADLALPDVAEYLDSLHATEYHALAFFDDRINDPRFIPSIYHQRLADLQPTVIITTNWDTLVENHFRSLGHRTAVITRDADVPLFDQQRNINILKIHGTIGDAASLVYRKSQYENYWRERPLLRSLLDVLLSTNHALFMGYGFGDPNILDLLSRLSGHGKFRREHWSLSYSTSPLHAVWGSLGIKVLSVIPPGSAVDPTTTTTNFLEALATVSGSLTTTNLARAKLVNRELERQIRARRPEARLRMRAQLGWLSNPEPSATETIYGSLEQDATERQMTMLVHEFLRLDPKNRARHIVSISLASLLRRYDFAAARRRLFEMRQNILTLGEQVEIVNADLDHNFNEMIFDDAASLIGYKVPSRNGIARVTTHHDRSTVQHQIRQFDDDFMDLIQPSTGTMSPQSIAQAREDVVKSIDTALEQLETLDASISTLPTDARLPHITRGLTMAVAWHGSSGQTREDGRTPFWVHPFRTMERVRRAVEPFSASLAVGALLHDVVEDTTASISEIHEAFGEDVAQIVQALTRREGMSEYEYLAQLAAGPIESRIVKLADRLDNVLELSEMRYSTFGRRTPQDYLNSSEEVLSACKQANPALASELASAIAGARHAFG